MILREIVGGTLVYSIMTPLHLAFRAHSLQYRQVLYWLYTTVYYLSYLPHCKQILLDIYPRVLMFFGEMCSV